MLPPKKNTTSENVKEALNALPLNKCLAKTYVRPNGDKCAGRLVLNHCEIVGSVAREIISRMPCWMQSNLFPPGSELVAAAHDIGKASPAFQEKIYRGTKDYSRNSFPELDGIDPDLDSKLGGHAGVSEVTAQFIQVGKYIPEILGQHHGFSPPITGLAEDEIFGGPIWQAQRIELIERLKANLGCDWPEITSLVQARAIAGLTSVADWIGSGPFFENPEDNWRTNVKAALDNAGFIQPALRENLSFQDIFGLTPHDTQGKLSEVAIEPGVYVLEAPMGLGKTEAALYSAYQAIVTGKATGLYFALPTQLTSEKIHSRLNAFLQKILDKNCPHKQALLLHGNAWLKEMEMGEEGQPGGSWFHAGKRGILAPFAAGTIDQALMAVMNVKHGFVRAFGLAGKVVILDEVHNYDSYTGTIIDKLVKALRELHCTVIILSATLTYDRRKELTGFTPAKSDYPLITAVPAQNSIATEITVDPLPDKEVRLQMKGNEHTAIEEILHRAEQGQQVLWIENTVEEAQKFYRQLAAKADCLNIACGLLHSRFLKVDREENENRWVPLFGKEGASKRGEQGRILVGTQVLEQSLDIDADFLVTRFCPTDMLLQRLGRLWRHENTIRPAETRCEAWLLMPELDSAIEDPEKAFGRTAFVYSPYVLCRSLEIWHALSRVTLPRDIRSLIEATYEPREETGPMANWLRELNEGSKKRKGREQLQGMALVSISEGGKTLPESKAATRHSDQDATECLLLTSVHHTGDQRSTRITLLNGEAIRLPKNGKSLGKREWRKLAAKIISNTVHIAEYLAPAAVPINRMKWLEDYVYLGHQNDEESRLRIAIVHPSGEIKALDGSNPSSKYQLEYDNRLGYQAKK